jgi:hypothetical protein
VSVLAFVRAPGRFRRPGALALVVSWALIALLACPSTARAGDDQPTQWQIDARAEPLQTAPPPAERPVICIVDTGVTPTPDLDIVSRTALDGGTPDDVTARPGHYGHGTTVAHMAAAKVNGWGSSGAFPHARIASVRIFDDVNQRVPWERYIRALRWCAEVRPLPIVTLLALGRPNASEEETMDVQSEITRRRDRDGMSIVAAVGNGGGGLDYPARTADAFAVAAHDGGELCSFSARGLGTDLAAPGCDLDQHGWDGAEWSLNGTSFAAPVVAGTLAAIRSYAPTVGAVESEQVLVDSAHASSVPRLDVTAALRKAGLSVIADSFVQPVEPPRPVAHALPEIAYDELRSPDSSAEPTTPFRPAVAHELPVPSRATYPWRLETPKATVRRTKISTIVRIASSTPSARVEVRVGRRVFLRRPPKIVLRGHPREIAVRLVSGRRRSAWVRPSTIGAES